MPANVPPPDTIENLMRQQFLTREEAELVWTHVNKPGLKDMNNQPWTYTSASIWAKNQRPTLDNAMTVAEARYGGVDATP